MQVINSEMFNFDVKIVTDLTDLEKELKNRVAYYQTSKNIVDFNMRLSVNEIFSDAIAQTDLDRESSYVKRTSALHEPSLNEDLADIEDKAVTLKADDTGDSDRVFYENMISAAMGLFFNTSHLVMLKNIDGYQTWAAINVDEMRKATKDGKETLCFSVAPILMNRWTGEALERYRAIKKDLEAKKTQ